MLRFAKIPTTTLIQGIDFNMLKNEKVQIPWVGKTPSQLDSNPYQMIQVQIQMIANHSKTLENLCLKRGGEVSPL